MNYLKIKSDNDRIYKENGTKARSEFISDLVPERAERTEKFILSEHIVPQTTIECILENSGRSIIALNFANALIAGGAYIIGGNAQEESLCRASMLYYTIRDTNAFYLQNRRHMLPDYTDGMIFSENVEVIRDDSGKLLEKPVICSFITCPAVNRREAVLMPKDKLNGVMERRTEKIVSLAASKSADIVILGAFGCGAFGNKREDILPMFERAVNAYGGDHSEYIFAIPQ